MMAATKAMKVMKKKAAMTTMKVMKKKAATKAMKVMKKRKAAVTKAMKVLKEKVCMKVMKKKDIAHILRRSNAATLQRQIGKGWMADKDHPRADGPRGFVELAIPGSGKKKIMIEAEKKNEDMAASRQALIEKEEDITAMKVNMLEQQIRELAAMHEEKIAYLEDLFNYF